MSISDNQYPAASPLERQQRAPVAEIAEGGTVCWLSRDQALPAGTKLFADQTPKGRGEQFAVPEGLHPRTADLVARFAAAVAEKLADAERKYGYSDGWADPAWMDECRAQLAGHVAKGDPRDVAAYCAFLWHHGEPTASKEPGARVGAGVDADDVSVRSAVVEALRSGVDPAGLRSAIDQVLPAGTVGGGVGGRSAPGDMGEGHRLCIYRQEDGDLIVSVVELGARFNPVSVEFCIPGSGGGRNGPLYWALSAAHAAMHDADPVTLAASCKEQVG